jgi:hypothetical protein
MKRLLAALAIAALAPWGAVAEDFPVTGKKLVMVRTPSGNEVFVFISRDVIRAPLPFGAEDPTLVGATLVVRSGSTSESVTFDLPADRWTRNTSASTFRYRNTQAPSGRPRSR